MCVCVCVCASAALCMCISALLNHPWSHLAISLPYYYALTGLTWRRGFFFFSSPLLEVHTHVSIVWDLRGFLNTYNKSPSSEVLWFPFQTRMWVVWKGKKQGKRPTRRIKFPHTSPGDSSFMWSGFESLRDGWQHRKPTSKELWAICFMVSNKNAAGCKERKLYSSNSGNLF